MALIREVPAPDFSDLFPDWRQPQGKSRWEAQTGGEILTGSGKAAITLVLRYLRSTEVISIKTDEVLMPQWLGYWVYNQVNEFARPVFSVGRATKVIMPYHQYGFPQKMAEIQECAESIGAVVVEDCAHALWMDSSLRLPQCADNFRIYSFSKFFFCYALGAVVGGDKSFRDFATAQVGNASRVVTLFNNVVKYLHEMHLSERLPDSGLWDNFLAMSYALYGKGMRPGGSAFRLMMAKIDAEIDCRRRRYSYFKDRFRHLEVERYLGEGDVAPYVIPLLLPLEKLKRLSASLQGAGFKTDIYNFDINRNLLDPKFEKVLWVLIHRGMTDSDFQRQIEIIEKGI